MQRSKTEKVPQVLKTNSSDSWTPSDLEVVKMFPVSHTSMYIRSPPRPHPLSCQGETRRLDLVSHWFTVQAVSLQSFLKKSESSEYFSSMGEGESLAGVSVSEANAKVAGEEEIEVGGEDMVH